MKLTADALNHLLSQNSWAKEKLQPLAGKTILLAVSPVQTKLTLLGDGTFAAASGDATADAEIRLGVGAALRMLVDPASAMGLASLSGDMELASTIGKVLQNLRWDTEEDISRIVGDIPAHELSRASRRIRQEIGRQASSVAGMFAEYWLEEDPLIAKKPHLDRFAREVDTLREDAERLEKRLARLEQSRG